MKKIIFACFLIITITSSCKKTQVSTETANVQFSEAKLETVRKFESCIIIAEENGVLKAYRGQRDIVCKNPMYNKKDSIPIKDFDFVLVAGTSEIIKSAN